ncbi:MAG: TVP38/TMEM64 family protein [Kiritimatiellia bacterium]
MSESVQPVTVSQTEKPLWRRMAPFVALSACFIVLGLLPGVRQVLRTEEIQRIARELGVWAPLAIVVFALVSPLAFIPRAPIAVVCGLLYGVALGGLLANVASLLGAWLHFRLARHAFSKAVRRHPVAARWRQALSDPHRAFLTLFLLRAFPLSNFTATNILAGALGMRGSVYLPATFLGMIPSTLFYACCGKLVRQPSLSFYLLLGVLFLVLLLGTLLARRRFQQV